VDSILIDEARTPLIISGQADDNLDVYTSMNKLVPHLVRQAEIRPMKKKAREITASTRKTSRFC